MWLNSDSFRCLRQNWPKYSIAIRNRSILFWAGLIQHGSSGSVLWGNNTYELHWASDVKSNKDPFLSTWTQGLLWCIPSITNNSGQQPPIPHMDGSKKRDLKKIKILTYKIFSSNVLTIVIASLFKFCLLQMWLPCQHLTEWHGCCAGQARYVAGFWSFSSLSDSWTLLVYKRCWKLNWQARGQVPVQSPKPQKAPKRKRGIWPLG